MNTKKKKVEKILKKPEWGYQEWETAENFQRFVLYRDMGPSRSFSDAAIQCGMVDKNGKATSSGVSTFSRLAKNNMWDKRMAALIEHQQKEVIKEETNERIQHKRKVRKRLSALSDALFKPLEVYIKRINNGSLDFNEIDAKTFYDMLCQLTNKTAILEDLRMKLDGEPTNLHQVDGEISNKIEIEIKHSKYESKDTGD